MSTVEEFERDAGTTKSHDRWTVAYDGGVKFQASSMEEIAERIAVLVAFHPELDRGKFSAHRVRVTTITSPVEEVAISHLPAVSA